MSGKRGRSNQRARSIIADRIKMPALLTKSLFNPPNSPAPYCEVSHFFFITEASFIYAPLPLIPKPFVFLSFFFFSFFFFFFFFLLFLLFLCSFLNGTLLNFVRVFFKVFFIGLHCVEIFFLSNIIELKLGVYLKIIIDNI